jgi:chromosome segregation ATPase
MAPPPPPPAVNLGNTKPTSFGRDSQDPAKKLEELKRELENMRGEHQRELQNVLNRENTLKMEISREKLKIKEMEDNLEAMKKSAMNRELQQQKTSRDAEEAGNSKALLVAEVDRLANLGRQTNEANQHLQQRIAQLELELETKTLAVTDMESALANKNQEVQYFQIMLEERQGDGHRALENLQEERENLLKELRESSMINLQLLERVEEMKSNSQYNDLNAENTNLRELLYVGEERYADLSQRFVLMAAELERCGAHIPQQQRDSLSAATAAAYGYGGRTGGRLASKENPPLLPHFSEAERFSFSRNLVN